MSSLTPEEQEAQQLDLPLQPESPFKGLSEYTKLLKRSIFEPSEAYKTLNAKPLSIPYALFFAVSVHWMGSALEFVWKSSLGKLFAERANFFTGAFEKIFNDTADTNAFPFEGLKQQFMTWIWGVGAVILDPIKTLYQILILSSFIWIAGKIFNQIPNDDESFKQRLSFSMALTLVCVSQGPSLLQGIPIYGTLVSNVLGFLTLMLGAHVIYRTTKIRGAIIAVFPSLIYYASILAGIALLLGLAFNFLSQFIWSM